MRVIVAYLLACTVAATITIPFIVFEFDGLSENLPTMDLFVPWIVAIFGIVLGGAGIIGGILAVPWLSMYFVFGVDRSRRNCILFGASCGLLSIVLTQIAIVVRWPAQLNEIDFGRFGSAILLFTFAGIVAGATYWVIAERNQT